MKFLPVRLEFCLSLVAVVLAATQIDAATPYAEVSGLAPIFNIEQTLNATGAGRFSLILDLYQKSNPSFDIASDRMTFFAPIDTAWTFLPPGDKEFLLAPDERSVIYVQELLEFHGVLPNQMQCFTWQALGADGGAYLNTFMERADGGEDVHSYSFAAKANGQGMFYINGRTDIIETADIPATNGFITTTRYFLQPYALAPPGYALPPGAPNMTQLLTDMGGFTTFLKILNASTILHTIPPPYSIFAIPDQVFGAVPPALLQLIFANTTMTNNFVFLHMVPRPIVFGLYSPRTEPYGFGANGLKNVVSSAAGLFINNNIRIIRKDLFATDAIIQVIQGVITTPANNIVFKTIYEALVCLQDAACANETGYYQFHSTIIRELLNETGMSEMLKNESLHFNFFAPTDEAFDALDPAILAAVENDTALLMNVLKYHVAPLPVPIRYIVQYDKTIYTNSSLPGWKLSLFQSGYTNFLYINEDVRAFYTYQYSNFIPTGNGYLYYIDKVLVPGAPTTQSLFYGAWDMYDCTYIGNKCTNITGTFLFSEVGVSSVLEYIVGGVYYMGQWTVSPQQNLFNTFTNVSLIPYPQNSNQTRRFRFYDNNTHWEAGGVDFIARVYWVRVTPGPECPDGTASSDGPCSDTPTLKPLHGAYNLTGCTVDGQTCMDWNATKPGLLQLDSNVGRYAVMMYALGGVTACGPFMVDNSTSTISLEPFVSGNANTVYNETVEATYSWNADYTMLTMTTTAEDGPLANVEWVWTKLGYLNGRCANGFPVPPTGICT